MTHVAGAQPHPDQPGLFDFRPQSEAERQFRAFDEANPELWRLFVRFTFEKIRAGHQHYGARDIIHRIRWETDVAEDSESGLKVNNIWSPWYARKFHKLFPQHDGFFRLRQAKADAVSGHA